MNSGTCFAESHRDSFIQTAEFSKNLEQEQRLFGINYMDGLNEKALLTIYIRKEAVERVRSMYVANTSTATVAWRNIERQLAVVRKRLTTGKRVDSACGDPAAWASAQALGSEIDTTEALDAPLVVIGSQADITSLSLNVVQDSLTEMRRLLVLASTPSADRTALNQQIAVQQNLIKTAVASAAAQGGNWLNNTIANNPQAVIGRDAGGNSITVDLDLQTGNFDLIHTIPQDGYLSDSVGVSGQPMIGFTIDGSTPLTAASGSVSIQNLITDIDTRFQRVTKASVTLSGFSSAIERSRAFNKTVNDIRNAAISGLVDADMETEQAKLQALLVRQQLAMNALSLINKSTANVLLLFKN